jgi:hypothetical protein
MDEIPKRRPGRPATGVDPVRGVRIPDKRWEKFDEATQAAGTDRSKAVNDFVCWYVREDGAKMPKRPPVEADE